MPSATPRQSTRVSSAPSLYVAGPASASLSTSRLPPVEDIPNSASPVGVTSTAPSVAVAPPSTSEPAPLRNHPLFHLPNAAIAHRDTISEKIMLLEPACSPEQEDTEEQVTRTPLQASKYGENPVLRNGSFKRPQNGRCLALHQVYLGSKPAKYPQRIEPASYACLYLPWLLDASSDVI